MSTDRELERSAVEITTGDSAAPSLARSALSGVAWNWAGAAILIVAQIASTAVTARLVAPREFGIYATAQAASAFASYFTLIGVGPGLQRRSALGEKTVGTALSISLVGSLLVAVALALSAPVWARAWGIPDAATVVRIIALTLLLTSAAIVPVALLRRLLQFRRAAVVETLSVIVGLAVGVILAIQLHSAVALASGQAFGAATLLTTSALIVRNELRLSFDRVDARELFGFASRVGGLNFLSYFTSTAPSWYAAQCSGRRCSGCTRVRA